MRDGVGAGVRRKSRGPKWRRRGGEARNEGLEVVRYRDAHASKRGPVGGGQQTGTKCCDAMSCVAGAAESHYVSAKGSADATDVSWVKARQVARGGDSDRRWVVGCCAILRSSDCVTAFAADADNGASLIPIPGAGERRLI